MPSNNKVSMFADVGVRAQARDSSVQSLNAMSNTQQSMNSTLVADAKAGTKQVAPEDAHTSVMKKLKLQIALNLHKILSKEVEHVGKVDYKALQDFVALLKTTLDGDTSFMQDALERLKNSRGQLADVVATNAVHMETGNTVNIQSANDIRILKSLLWRAGTAIRLEAPLMLENTHTRIQMAHMMLQEADFLAQRAQNMLATIKAEFGLSAKDITLLATDKVVVSADNMKVAGKTNVFIHSDGKIQITSSGDTTIVSDGVINIQGSRIDLNPQVSPQTTSIDPVTVSSGIKPNTVSKGKKHLELPQWEGMSAIPAFVTPEDEIKLQDM